MDHLIVINNQDYENAKRYGIANDSNMTLMQGIGIDLAEFSMPQDIENVRSRIRTELSIPDESVFPADDRGLYQKQTP